MTSAVTAGRVMRSKPTPGLLEARHGAPRGRRKRAELEGSLAGRSRRHRAHRMRARLSLGEPRTYGLSLGSRPRADRMARTNRRRLPRDGAMDGRYTIASYGDDPGSFAASVETIFFATVVMAYPGVVRMLAPHLQPSHRIVLFPASSAARCPSLECSHPMVRRRCRSSRPTHSSRAVSRATTREQRSDRHTQARGNRSSFNPQSLAHRKPSSASW